ncbi:MAG TPA: S1-like domain-containing RNA-binding protein [Chitinophagaceae bacterium]|nr:S1-like domain-containing RNA-binding protein [Chitinophagaceae bacterium]
MLKIGDYNTLKIDRATSVGFYLTDGQGNDVLLPNKYIKKHFKVGNEITVFIYKDYEQRWIATTLNPWIKINEFASLRVRSVSDKGAFLEWGLEKDIFVPYREQSIKMKEGFRYIVYLYEDELTNRLVASSKINKFLNNENFDLEPGSEVDLLIFETTLLGFNAIINQKYKGLIYHNEIFQEIKIGNKLKGYIKNIREDNSIDLSLQPKGFERLEQGAEKILNYLQEHKGILYLTDDSSPEDIQRVLLMSKKNFKKSIGILYKKKLITLNQSSISLIK